MLDRILRQHERVAAEDVVDVRALLRQHVDVGDVGGGAAERGELARVARLLRDELVEVSAGM